MVGSLLQANLDELGQALLEGAWATWKSGNPISDEISFEITHDVLLDVLDKANPELHEVATEFAKGRVDEIFALKAQEAAQKEQTLAQEAALAAKLQEAVRLEAQAKEDEARRLALEQVRMQEVSQLSAPTPTHRHQQINNKNTNTNRNTFEFECHFQP